ncbi:protein of unknown function [Chryseobacterium sp. JV274]|nr:protein of unknown function [Chryseobacterium sp. JV274]
MLINFNCDLKFIDSPSSTPNTSRHFYVYIEIYRSRKWLTKAV